MINFKLTLFYSLLFSFLFVSANLITDVDISQFDRVVVIPDIHGDAQVFSYVMKEMEIMDDDLKYNKNHQNGKQIIIQLGDVADRGPMTMKIYEWFKNMRLSAEKNGDLIVNLLGNHDVMLMCGNTHYFSLDELANVFQGDRVKVATEFSKTGAYGKLLREFYQTYVHIDDVFFVHAGLEEWHEVRSVQNAQKLLMLEIDILGCPMHHEYAPISGNGGPLWTRTFSNAFNRGEDSCDMCHRLEELKEKWNFKKMFVGHTPTLDGSVGAYCDGSYYMHDTAMSRWMGGIPVPTVSVLTPSFLEDGVTRRPLSEWNHHVHSFNLSTDGKGFDRHIEDHTTEPKDETSDGYIKFETECKKK